MNNFSSQKKGFLASKKYKKIHFWGQWLYNIYLTIAKSKTLSLFTQKHSKISIAEDIIYRPGIYNLQTSTATFRDQEKLLEKADGG